jgi:hypothetical protein
MINGKQSAILCLTFNRTTRAFKWSKTRLNGINDLNSRFFLHFGPFSGKNHVWTLENELSYVHGRLNELSYVHKARLAQSVEHKALNLVVAGLSPTVGV